MGGKPLVSFPLVGSPSSSERAMRRDMDNAIECITYGRQISTHTLVFLYRMMQYNMLYIHCMYNIQQLSSNELIFSRFVAFVVVEFIYTRSSDTLLPLGQGDYSQVPVKQP